MTSIDDLKHDIKTVSDSVLSSLSPEERVRMFAKTSINRDEEHREWLRESIPASSYADYRDKMTIALGLSRSATYGLHMGYMQYQLAEERAQNELLRAFAMPEVYDEDAGEEGSLMADIALDHNRLMDLAHQKVETAAIGLYIEYHANKRFANKVLDVTLEEFLALSPPGWLDDVDFAGVLEHAEEADKITDPIIVDDDGNTEEMLLEDAVETLYDELVRNWEGDLEEDEP